MPRRSRNSVLCVEQGATEANLTIVLAAIFIGLNYPVYQWVLGRLRGRKALAATATLVLLLVLVMAPLLAVLGAAPRPAFTIAVVPDVETVSISVSDDGIGIAPQAMPRIFEMFYQGDAALDRTSGGPRERGLPSSA